MSSHSGFGRPSEFTADLETCSREPIRIPGSIQPQGSLFVLSSDDLTVLQAAVGHALRDEGVANTAGRALADVLPPSLAPLVEQLAAKPVAGEPTPLGYFAGADGGGHQAIAHRSGGTLILELEQADPGDPGSFEDVYPFVSSFLAELHGRTSLEELCSLAARGIRRITGLDRVLVYRFDEDWNGSVIAEDRNARLPSYMGLRFPASDIPAQARELYRLNRLRLIADANYRPIPIVPPLSPVDGQPTDLSFAVLRSVSPIHLEYMRNMGTGASMSISLLRDGRLWGLISCHNAAPHRVPYHMRTACDFVGQILSLQLAAREQAALADRRVELRAVQARLLAQMASAETFIDGLIADPASLLSLTGASGAAIVAGGECRLIGDTPSEGEVRRVADWLAASRHEDVVVIDSLAGVMPGGDALKDRASGVLAFATSRLHSSYVVWFRPEVVRTIAWGGSPAKPVTRASEDGRIHPRKSFDVWRESVRLRAIPWDGAEVEAAAQLRSAIVDIVLRSAEELALLNEQLVRSNKELEAFSYSVSHDLRAPFRHIVGYAELLKQYEGAALSERGNRYIGTIIESAVSAGTLVDDLLSFSQMGRATLHPRRIDMNQLVAEVRQRLEMVTRGRRITWQIGNLAPARADPTMLRLVIQNLLENAVKFTRGRDQAMIEIASRAGAGETVYFVRDNGVGFEMDYVGKLFGVFQRLHRVEEFEGTGIGLANVKRIVEQRHGGRVWAEAVVDQGATLFFALPDDAPAEGKGDFNGGV